MTTFFFKNVPHDGIPFDAESELEILKHQALMRNMHCSFCGEIVQVNGANIVGKNELCLSDAQGFFEDKIIDMALYVDGDAWIECPVCGMFNDTSQVEGE